MAFTDRTTQGTPGISLFTTASIVVANMVGTGVFTSLGFQALGIKSGFVLMALWLLGGVLALCGALCYGRLAAALPRSGGEYHFLARLYHPSIGFGAGVVSATVGFAAPLALAAMALARYFATIFPGYDERHIASAATIGVALVHLRSVRLGGRFQVAATVLKLALIGFFIGAGFWAGTPSGVIFAPQPGDAASLLSPAFGVSLIFVMYAYSGWNAATYIINEIRAPARTVPLALLVGTGIVTVLYLALNAVFLRTTPIPELAGKMEVGDLAARHIFGTGGGHLMSGLICLALVSTLSAMTWAGPRVLAVMGEDLPALRSLARLNPGGVPVLASVLQLALVNAFIWSGRFETVLLYAQFTLNLCTLLAVFGVFVLWRRGDSMRALWGWPVTPLFFLLITGASMGYLLVQNPRESLAGLATMLGAIVIFLLVPRAKPSVS